MNKIRILLVLLLFQGSSAASTAAIRISAGDRISLKVLPAEEFSQELLVAPDGKIVLPLIGSIQVAGLTSQELQNILEGKLARYVAHPKVTVNIHRFSSRRVSIIGEIRSPGYYEFKDGMMLLGLVSQAGGVSATARSSHVRILRRGRSGKDVALVDLEAILKGDMSKDVALKPGDTVVVPKKRFAARTQWLQTNILPWANLLGTLASIIILIIIL